MFLLLIDSCVSLWVFLPLTLEGEAQETHFGLLLLCFIFCLLAGVTVDPKLNSLWDCSSTGRSLVRSCNRGHNSDQESIVEIWYISTYINQKQNGHCKTRPKLVSSYIRLENEMYVIYSILWVAAENGEDDLVKRDASGWNFPCRFIPTQDIIELPPRQQQMVTTHVGSVRISNLRRFRRIRNNIPINLIIVGLEKFSNRQGNIETWDFIRLRADRLLKTYGLDRILCVKDKNGWHLVPVHFLCDVSNGPLSVLPMGFVVI